MGKRAAVSTPAGEPGLPRSNDRAPDRAGSADPMAVQPLRRRRRDQQLGGLGFDLRRRQLTLAAVATEIVISNEVAATLRGLQLLDTDCQRLVFRIRAHHDGGVLAATDDELDELISAVAAEANHELNRRRRLRLDAAFDALNEAAADGR
jgi:hypothetical protein